MTAPGRPDLRLTRRSLLKLSAAAGALGLTGAPFARAQSREKTLLIAAAATPLSLDVENSLSLGTIDTVGAFYDYLIAFEMIPDPDAPGVMREDLAADPSKPGGYNLKGKLAESWEFSEDGKVARFTLRRGVKSNWGNELTAHDVKYTFDRKFEVKGAGAFMTGVMGLPGKDAVVVEDDHTVSFRLDDPNPILMIVSGHLANPIFDSVKCREMATEDDPWARKFLDTNVAGFGPYDLKEITRGQQLVAVARPDYYGEKPFFETVVFREVPASATRLQLLQGGAVDIALSLAPTEMKALAAAKDATVTSISASQMQWIGLNAAFKPLDDPKVRLALNHALPKQEIIDTVLQGYATPMTTLMPAFYPGATDAYYDHDFDIDRAKTALAEAGYPDGFETVLAYNAGNPVEEPIAILYQTALKKIGVRLTLKKLPAGTFFDSLVKRLEPMIFMLDAPWTPDPGFALNLYFHSDSFVDFSNYRNAEVDALIRESLSTLDAPKRMAAVDAAQKILFAEAPWAMIANPGYHLAHGTDIGGLAYFTSNRLSFQSYARV